MKFTITSDCSGRLRVRAGQYMFQEEQGQGLVSLLSARPFVEKVETCSKNGSILVLYTHKSARKDVLSFLRTLAIKDIPSESLPEEVVMAKQEVAFQLDFTRLVGGHYLKKWLIPSWLKPWYHSFKALSYIKEGVLSLFRGHVSVEVLDATAIGVSLLRNDISTASSTMFLLQLSELLLEYSNTRAKNQLTRSLAVYDQVVWLVEEEERQIPLESLEVGQAIHLRTGSMIPVDGTIVSGDALLNESSMTGEPLAVHKEQNGSVFAGTLVEEGDIIVKVVKLGNQTRIAQIVDVIHSGEDTKASIQGKAERLADGIVPYSFGLFLGTYLFTGNMTRALSVLMVDFSCAIKLTTPISVISALKESAEHGVIVKGGKYLEILSQVDTVVFDKTGTLTEAVPSVAKILSLNPQYSENQVLTLVACMEEHFPHSVASAIVKEAEIRGLAHPEFHEKVEYIVAHGIVTQQNGVRSCVGSYHFIFEDEAIPYPQEKETWLKEEIGNYSAVYFAMNGELVGVICVYDPPRIDAKQVVAQLKHLGIPHIKMLTGDSYATAKSISEELGIDSFVASVLPDEKATHIQQWKSEGHTVLMVGDGINDAPALSCADVSITLAGSSDIAREVADISILSHELQQIIYIRQLSTELMAKISQHYHGIAVFNALLILGGMFGISTASLNAWLHNVSTLGFAALSTRSLLRDDTGKESTNETA